MKSLSGVCLLFLMLSVAPSIVQAEQMKYKWKSYSFEYGEGWKITLDTETEERRNVRLETESSWPVSIYITLFSKAPATSDNPIPQVPLGEGFCLPIGLKLAGDLKGSAVGMTDGSIETSEGTEPSGFLSVYPPDGKSFYHLHCLGVMHGDVFYLSAIQIQGIRGDVNQDASFHNRVKEAYAIVRSIRKSAAPENSNK